MEGLAADGSSAGIQAGEIMTVEDLLYCMLVVSANEACNVLAEAVSGSVDAFVDAMNAKADALGCENTHFVNTTGLHDSQHYTTAWDLYLITREAMSHDDFMRICDTARVTIPATNLSEERNLYTTNYLIDTWRSLGYIYSDAHGIKTGSTDEAGHCLVSSAADGSSVSFHQRGPGRPPGDPGGRRDPHLQLLMTPGSSSDWAFDNYSYQTVLESAELVKEASVALSKVDHVAVHPAEDVELLLPNGTDPAAMERRLELESPAEAPISTGQTLGTISLTPNDETLAKVDLLAANDVEASGLLVFLRNARKFFTSTPVKVAAGIAAVLIAALVIWKLTVGRRRYGTAAASPAAAEAEATGDGEDKKKRTRSADAPQIPLCRQEAGDIGAAAAGRFQRSASARHHSSYLRSPTHEETKTGARAPVLFSSQVFHQLLQGPAVTMEPGGMRPLRRITQRQQGDGDQPRQLRESGAELLRLEHAHIGGAQTQLRGLEHHLRSGDGRVDLPVLLTVSLPLPGHSRVIGHHQHHRRVEMDAGAAIHLLQSLRAPQNKDPLGLEIVGGGGAAARLQHGGELLRLHGPITELPQGVPLRGELGKIHGNASFLFYDTCILAQPPRPPQLFSHPFPDGVQPPRSTSSHSSRQRVS